MNWIDLALIGIVALSVLSGFAHGFARVGISFAAAVAGILFGFWSYGMAAAYIEDYVNSRPIANLVGFCIILLIFVVVGGIVGRIVERLFKWAGLSWFDRLLGGAAGFVRGVVVGVALVTVLLAFAPNPPPASVVDSQLVPYLASTSDVLASVTP